MMGCSPRDHQCNQDEKPLHEVEITESFQLGRFEVTQGEWARVITTNPSGHKGNERLPVENVSWNAVQTFLSQLNAMKDGYFYRLPTEAEWEYAARGGTTGPVYAKLDEIAWYRSNSKGLTHLVGEKQQNGYGLYDMLGNVKEWCSDWLGDRYYRNSPLKDPAGPASGTTESTNSPYKGPWKIVRGGSFFNDADQNRVSSRSGYTPTSSNVITGFRVCRVKL